MKKTTGKVVSLVLALALVVSSFSGTFAFAASRNETGTAGFTNDTFYFANGTKADGTTLKDSGTSALLGTLTLETADHLQADDITIAAISHTSGDSLINGKVVNGNVDTLQLKSKDGVGQEVLSVLLKGTVVRDDNTTVTVSARKTITVNVVKAGGYVLGSNDYSFANDGISAPSALGDLAKTDSKTAAVYTVTDDHDLIAKYTLNNVGFTFSASTGTATGIATGDQTLKFNTTTGLITTLKATPKSFTVTATKLATSTDAKVELTNKCKIVAKVQAPSNYTTIDSYGGETYLVETGYTVKDSANRVSVTGSDVVLSESTTMTKGSVKNVTSTNGSTFTVTKGSVSSIDTKGSVTVDGGTVGSIKTSGSVNVTGGTVASIEATGSATTTAVTINGGTVSGDIKAATVNINPSNDKVAVTVSGKITASDLTADSSTAKVALGAVKANSDGSITLTGTATTVGTIDFDYRADNLYLVNFTGAIPAVTHSGNAIINADINTTATIKGAVTAASIASAGSLTFDGSVTVNDLSGSGSVTVGAGNLFVKSSISGVTLKFSDKDLKVGTVAFKATADAVSVDDATTYGYTLAKVSGDKIDSFTIKTVVFAGLVFNESSSQIAKGNSKTFTVSNYPSSTSLPAGDTIKLDFDGNENYFKVTYAADNKSATVQVLDYDKDFASENIGTLKATVVDADGSEATDYAAGTCAVTAIAVPLYVSDTTNDFSIAAGKTYQFKITSDTTPVLTVGTSGVFTIAPYVHAAGTNVYYYTVTAVGKVGTATGFYINGNKLLVASVSAPAYTSDTHGNVTVKGAYTVKINAAAIPSFVIGSSNVFKASFVSKTGNDYFYKISSVGAVGTKAGIYINGLLTFVGIVG